MSSVRQILSPVWDRSFDHAGARVDSYVSYLRNKIDSHGDPSCIQTIPGAGYRFDPCAGE